MGEEISNENFDAQDFDRFHERLVDAQGQPSKVNAQVLNDCANPLLTMELAKFNLEINGHPFVVDADVLSHMEADLSELYYQVQQSALGFGAHTVLFGVLPSLHRAHLNTDE